MISVGNYMNGGSTRGQAYGVKFDVLIKISAVKASNSKMGSLLNFVARTVEKHSPDACKYMDSWESMWAAAEVPYKQLEADMKTLSLEIDRTKNELNNNVPKLMAENPEMGGPLEKRLKEFLAVAGPRMDDLKIKLSQTGDAVRDVMAKYGEGKSEDGGDPFKDFFNQMVTFSRAFKNAVDLNIKERLEAEKKAAKTAGGNTAAPAKTNNDTEGAATTKKQSDNIFGNFHANKGASQGDLIAEFKKRTQKKI